jgi:hypothetical protein
LAFNLIAKERVFTDAIGHKAGMYVGKHYLGFGLPIQITTSQ